MSTSKSISGIFLSLLLLAAAAPAAASAGSLAVSATDPADSLRLFFGDGGQRFSTQSPLVAGEALMASLTNGGEATDVLRVFALAAEGGGHRSYLIRLEAGDSASLVFTPEEGFGHLFVLGNQPFSLRMDGLESGEGRRLEAGEGAERGFQQISAATQTSARGEWRLTCIDPEDCTYVSPWHLGRVIDYDQVYWNLHTPIGPNSTSNGSCPTIWWDYHPVGGYPRRALNCYGQTYSVSWRPIF